MLCMCRNFVQTALGQMKTVYPNVYTFRQEMLQSFGTSTTGYQLTVEPNFTGLQEDGRVEVVCFIVGTCVTVNRKDK